MSEPLKWSALVKGFGAGVDVPRLDEVWQDKDTGAAVRIVTADCMMETDLDEWACVRNMPAVVYCYPGQRLGRIMIAPEFVDRFVQVHRVTP